MALGHAHIQDPHRSHRSMQERTCAYGRCGRQALSHHQGRRCHKRAQASRPTTWKTSPHRANSTCSTWCAYRDSSTAAKASDDPPNAKGATLPSLPNHSPTDGISTFSTTRTRIIDKSEHLAENFSMQSRGCLKNSLLIAFIPKKHLSLPTKFSSKPTFIHQ